MRPLASRVDFTDAALAVLELVYLAEAEGQLASEEELAARFSSGFEDGEMTIRCQDLLRPALTELYRGAMIQAVADQERPGGPIRYRLPPQHRDDLINRYGFYRPLSLTPGPRARPSSLA